MTARGTVEGMALIRIKDLYKTYGSSGKAVDVLKGVDLSIEKGETVSIIGASGAGKSTLLNIMGALDRPTSGEIFYGEDRISGFNEKRLAAFRNKFIGFVFQFHHLLPEFTAIENVMLPALIGGTGPAEAREKAEGLLREVGLGNRLDHKPGELSGGEQQRAAVVRALIQAPELVLADEPTGNLDAVTGAEVIDLFAQLNREHGITLVVVTHEERVSRVARRVLRLAEGKLREEAAA